MKNQNTKKIKSMVDPTWFIAVSVVLISLYFNPSLADPFNSPKLWLLMICGSWLSGYCIIKFKKDKNKFSKNQKIHFLILTLFIISLFIASIFSDRRFIAFVGEQQRKQGFIFYLFMAIFMLSSSMFFNTARIYKIFYMAVFLAFIYGVYGTMQHLGNDFIDWNNPYNSIILTLGNPNYASALMSVLSVLLVSFSFTVKNKIKPLFLALGLTMIFLITLSKSRQGLVAFGFGISVFVIIYTYLKSRKVAYGFLVIILPLISLVIAGMLQIGPFTQYLYKASVSIRGYYWRAGIDMFKSNPLFGVGVDNYGENFKIFREVGYPLTYGFTITSDNAHNVPIQIFATAGVFSGIFYLVLIFLVLASAFRAIKILKSEDKILVASLFSAWIAFQAQSIISIDNVGLSIWGWVLGGMLIGLGFGHTAESENIVTSSVNKKPTEDLLSTSKIISAFITLIGVIVCSFLYQGEKYLYDLTRYVNYSSQNQSENFYLTLKKFDESRFVEPAYRFRTANLMFQIGKIDEANSRVEQLLKVYPDSFDYLFGLAQIKSYKEDWRSVSDIRERIAKIDPWNAENYLLLAKAYENLGEYEKAKSNYNKILSFASDKPIAQDARISLRKIS